MVTNRITKNRQYRGKGYVRLANQFDFFWEFVGTLLEISEKRPFRIRGVVSVPETDRVFNSCVLFCLSKDKRVFFGLFDPMMKSNINTTLQESP